MHVQIRLEQSLSVRVPRDNAGHRPHDHRAAAAVKLRARLVTVVCDGCMQLAPDSTAVLAPVRSIGPDWNNTCNQPVLK